MRNTIALTGVLFALWLLLSGHYTPWFIFLGAVSTVVSVWVALRMDVTDEEGVPVVHLNARILTYLPWLVWEVFKSNVTVARAVLSPGLPISPTVTRFRAMPETELGRVILANSVTMTPGTVTVAVTGEELHVHALFEEGAEGLDESPMNRRVAALERLV